MKDYLKNTIKTYDKTVKEYKKYTRSLIGKKRINLFISMLPKGARVLDVGCSFGKDCKFFVNKGFEAYGIDLSKNMIKEARKYEKRAKYYVMDIRNLKFQNNYFDGIWCCATIHHLKKKDVPKALNEFYRVLKKGGILYVDAKHGKREETIPDLRFNNLPKFYSFFYLNEFKQLIKKCGFSITKSFFDRGYKYTRIVAKKYAVVIARK